MTMTQWLLFFLIIQVVHFLATWKLYVKAGRKAWEAAVPIYNAVVLMGIINRPKWWVILLFIPIINLIMFPVVWVETIRSFGRNSTLDTWLVVLTLGFYIFYVSYGLDVEYKKDRDLKPRSAAGEWVSSILFAVVAATLVHTYFMQPYVIPTSSLEKTLMIGDFLFVSKFHYGARTPMTTVSFPMVHDTIPVVKSKSYLNKPQLPYFRLPGFQKIKRNDIVVFSWPADTVRQFFKKEKGVEKPIDKKSNYVKRCVGLPGDSLQIIDGRVHINGERLVLSDRAKPQYHHVVTTKGPLNNNTLNALGRKNYAGSLVRIPQDVMKQSSADRVIAERTFLTRFKEDSTYVYFTGGISEQNVANVLKAESTKDMALFNMTEEEAKAFANSSEILSVERFIEKKPGNYVFPQSAAHRGTNDNFGPIYIPEAGKTVPLNLDVLPLYKKIITKYEGNTISVAGNQISINGQVADSYTFKQDYFWMMGDNRHRSEDSRVWGYVPYNHVVGKPVFIWMSIDNFNDGLKNWSIRWDRVFTTVGGSGKSVSYFRYFIGALLVWIGFNYFRKRKKKAA